MLVITIIKRYETHPLRSDTHASLSNILIKLWVIVTIRIKLLSFLKITLREEKGNILKIYAAVSF